MEVLNRAPEYISNVNGTEYTMDVGEYREIIMPLIVSPDGGTPSVTIINAPSFVSCLNIKDLKAMPATLKDAITH